MQWVRDIFSEKKNFARWICDEKGVQNAKCYGKIGVFFSKKKEARSVEIEIPKSIYVILNIVKSKIEVVYEIT